MPWFGSIERLQTVPATIYFSTDRSIKCGTLVAGRCNQTCSWMRPEAFQLIFVKSRKKRLTVCPQLCGEPAGPLCQWIEIKEKRKRSPKSQRNKASYFNEIHLFAGLVWPAGFVGVSYKSQEAAYNLWLITRSMRKLCLWQWSKESRHSGVAGVYCAALICIF